MQDIAEREQTQLHKVQCDSSESDNTDCNELSTDENTLIRKTIKLKNEPLHLQCEWRDCDHLTHDIDDFVHHIGFHIPQLETRMN
jgi:hypothetical protein